MKGAETREAEMLDRVLAELQLLRRQVEALQR
jgi:hypothetical protein